MSDALWRFAAWIARTGQNPAFVAFNAHCWFAFAVVYTAASAGHSSIVIAAIVTALAAVKEFTFDATQEHDPPQTFDDDLLDFAGYVTGATLAIAAAACLL